MIKDTKLYFLEDDCLSIFGESVGKEIIMVTETIYEQLCNKADEYNNEEIKYHLTMNLFPTMAYYKALRVYPFEQEVALDYVRKETKRAAEIKKIEQAKILKMPCSYLMYRLFVKRVMKKKFPSQGWETEWVRCDSKEIHFNLTRCIYYDLCEQNNCPELCPVYCENDDIAFSGLMPKIRFERAGTIGKGSKMCDFHFIKNK